MIHVFVFLAGLNVGLMAGLGIGGSLIGKTVERLLRDLGVKR
jgi:hypothetical protein